MTTVIDAWRLAPAGPADRADLHRMFDRCSADTRYLRFFAPLRNLPAHYLDEALAQHPDRHDALTARHPDTGRLLALASLAAPPTPAPSAARTAHPDTALLDAAGPGSAFPGAAQPDTAPPELALLVEDAWQRQGIGTALVGLLLARARARGVRAVTVRVLPGRSALTAAVARRLPPGSLLHAERTGTELACVFALH